MTSMIEKNCRWCGKSMSVSVTDHNKGLGKYCSHSCKGKWLANKRKRKMATVFSGRFSVGAEELSPALEDEEIQKLCGDYLDDEAFSSDPY